MSHASRLSASVVAMTLVMLMPSASSRPAASSGAALVKWCGASKLPRSVAHRYSLSVRVRPLLFWITRNDVGAGRVVRGEGPNGARSIELLIGSDPQRTPMSVNRWGYIVETNRGSDGELVGVMTEAEERTVQEATATISGASGAGQRLRAIRASIEQGDARAQVIQVTSGRTFTYRDVDAVLRELPEGGSATATLRVPRGTSPGFLCAVADMMRATVEESRGERPSSLVARSSSFVYDRSLYDLRLVSSTPHPEVVLGSRTYRKCLETQFEVRNRSTGNTSSFTLTYGTTGAVAEVPLRIVYRPRWWFEAQLTLEEGQ